MFKCLPILFARSLQSLIVHYLGKSHLHIEIILVNGIFDTVRRPLEFAFEDLAFGPKFGGCSISYSDHLPCPTSRDAIPKFGEWNLTDRLRSGHTSPSSTSVPRWQRAASRKANLIALAARGLLALSLAGNAFLIFYFRRLLR